MNMLLVIALENHREEFFAYAGKINTRKLRKAVPRPIGLPTSLLQSLSAVNALNIKYFVNRNILYEWNWNDPANYYKLGRIPSSCFF